MEYEPIIQNYYSNINCKTLFLMINYKTICFLYNNIKIFVIFNIKYVVKDDI